MALTSLPKYLPITFTHSEDVFNYWCNHPHIQASCQDNCARTFEAVSFWKTPRIAARWLPVTMAEWAFCRYACNNRTSAGTLPLRSHSTGERSGGKSAIYAGGSGRGRISSSCSHTPKIQPIFHCWWDVTLSAPIILPCLHLSMPMTVRQSFPHVNPYYQGSGWAL